MAIIPCAIQYFLVAYLLHTQQFVSLNPIPLFFSSPLISVFHIKQLFMILDKGYTRKKAKCVPKKQIKFLPLKFTRSNFLCCIWKTLNNDFGLFRIPLIIPALPLSGFNMSPFTHSMLDFLQHMLFGRHGSRLWGDNKE